MLFTSGPDWAFERLMQEKPGFDHYDSGGADAPEDCGTCRFYRPDWKYQFCRFAECPYQPGKLTDLAAVKFTVKGAEYRRPSDNAEKALKFQTFSYLKCVGWRPCCDMPHDYSVLFILCWLFSSSKRIIM